MGCHACSNPGTTRDAREEGLLVLRARTEGKDIFQTSLCN